MEDLMRASSFLISSSTWVRILAISWSSFESWASTALRRELASAVVLRASSRLLLSVSRRLRRILGRIFASGITMAKRMMAKLSHRKSLAVASVLRPIALPMDWTSLVWVKFSTLLWLLLSLTLTWSGDGSDADCVAAGAGWAADSCAGTTAAKAA